MAKSRKPKTKSKSSDGLIPDMHPPESAKILSLAEEYKEAQRKRLAAAATEKRLKAEVISLVKDSGILPVEDGVIDYRIDNKRIKITPRDELLQVLDLTDEDGEDGKGDDNTTES